MKKEKKGRSANKTKFDFRNYFKKL